MKIKNHNPKTNWHAGDIAFYQDGESDNIYAGRVKRTTDKGSIELTNLMLNIDVFHTPDELFKSYTAVTDEMRGITRKAAARTVKFNVYVSKDISEYFGIIRNQEVRETAPRLSGELMAKATRALEQHPEMFRTCPPTSNHKAPYYIAPNLIIQGRFHQSTVLAAARNNLILSAVDEQTGISYRPDDIDDLQQACDDYPEFFQTTPLNIHTTPCDGLAVQHAMDVGDWESLAITWLVYKGLVLAAHKSGEPREYLDISQVQRARDYGYHCMTVDTDDKIKDRFPYLY